MSDESRRTLLRGSRNLAVSTMVCRVLGFLREMLMASALGAGMRMSAWVLALTLPSLFRRILGEGALGSALIPMMVHSMGTEGPMRARERFSTIFCYLTLLLTAISVLISLPAYCFGSLCATERWRLAAYLVPLVMPYCVFICAVGVLSSFANSLREYFLPSLAAILQNFVMIAALFGVAWLWRPGEGGTAPLRLLAFSVILAGVLELFLMFWIVRRKGMGLVFSKNVFGDMESVKSLLRLALPGIAGASALQASLIVDRCVAGFLSDYAPSALYFSERLVYLPLGVFAFAFGTVSLSEMSRAAVAEDYREMAGMLMFSLRNLLFVTLPIAMFMFLFCEDLIKVFYMRGSFDAQAVRETVSAMIFYVPGIPLFASSKVLVAAFTARKDMMTPFKISLCTVALNIILNFSLMIPLRQGGIALATVLSSLAGNLILLTILVRRFGAGMFEFGEFGRMIGRTLLLCALAGAAAFFAAEWIPRTIRFSAYWRVCAGAGAFGFVFFVCSILLKMEELHLFLTRIPGMNRK